MGNYNSKKIFFILLAASAAVAMLAVLFASGKKDGEKKEYREKKVYDANQVLNAPYEKKENFVLDPAAKHSCKIEPASLNLSEGDSSALNVILEKSASGKEGELDLGNMPRGIDAVFSQNNGYSLEIGSRENGAEIQVGRVAGSQKGSLSIPVFFSEKNNGGKMSTAVCQLNVIAK